MPDKNLAERWRRALKKLARILGLTYLPRTEKKLVQAIQKQSLRRLSQTQAKFVILTGPSGVGKNEIAKYLNKKIIRLPHVTSRKPRPGEKEGREYFFISKKQFRNWIRAGRFLAYRKTYGDYRGVSKDYFLKYLEAGKIFFIERTVLALLKFGKLPLIKKTPFLNVYILPSQFKDLAERIGGRTKKDRSLSAKAVADRLTQAVEQLELLVKKSTLKKPLYKLFLVNPQAKNKKEINAQAKKIAQLIVKTIK